MKATEISATICEELKETLAFVEDAQAEALVEKIVNAKRVFLAGAGRSLLMVKCCAMRLMQIGLDVHVAGETTTPSIQKEDLLLVVSGSGETQTVVMMTQKAKNIGAQAAVITIVPQSAAGKLADVVVTIPASSTKVAEGNFRKSIQLGGSLFEISTLLFLETVVMLVARKLQIEDPNKLLMQNHANLE